MTQLTSRIKLSPGESALIGSIIEHVYPEPCAGTALPIERDEVRAARGMARKGLVTVAATERGGNVMTFTELGASVYHRERVAVGNA